MAPQATMKLGDRVDDDTLTGFFVMCAGQIEVGDFKGVDQLYCKYDFTYGSDWVIVQGVDKGISQIASECCGPLRGARLASASATAARRRDVPPSAVRPA